MHALLFLVFVFAHGLALRGRDYPMPREVEVGELMITTMLGAYSSVAASEFNGFSKVWRLSNSA